MAFTTSDDLNILQASDSTDIGAGAGNDTYIINSSSTSNGQTINITDTEGTNTIKLVDGVTIIGSIVSANSIQLVVSNGTGTSATINIFGADTFTFETGGDPFTTGSGTVQTFDAFVTGTLGVAAVPTGSNTATGTANTVIGSTTTTSTGQTFTLTTATDTVPGLTGSGGNTSSTGDDTFIGTDGTLTSGDTIIDAGTTTGDTFRYASSSTTVAVAESGFAIENVEIIQVTADATLGTTFDMTGVDGATTYINDNSSQNLTTTGIQNLVSLKVEDVNGGNSTIQFIDNVLSGSSDTLALTLDNVQSNTSAATSTINIGNSTSNGLSGVETINIVTENSASLLTNLVTGAATINVSGNQNLSIGIPTTGANAILAGATVINAAVAGSVLTGNLSVVADSAANDVVITGGTGDDFADFGTAASFDTGDSFDGGDGTDTIGLNDNTATGTLGGTVSNVEALSIIDGMDGTIDMDNFSGITTVNLLSGLDGDTIIDDIVTGTTVRVDTDDNTAATHDLTVAMGTESAVDELTLRFDDVDTNANTDLAVLTTTGIETVNLQVNDDADTTVNGDLDIATFTNDDMTTLNISGNGDLSVGNGYTDANADGIEDDAGIPRTNTDSLVTINASTSTGSNDLTDIELAAGGATVTFGSGADSITSGAGGDNLTGGTGNDSYLYTAVAQSDSNGFDTITDFATGDVTNLFALLDTITSTRFEGNFATFAQAQGALDAGTQTDIVYQQDENFLWLDANADGTLDNNDLRIKLEGVSSITAEQLGFTTGNSITLNAAAANVNATTSTNASAVTTINDDAITSTDANLAGSTVDGLAGNDTLTVTDQATAANFAAGPNLTNIEVFNFSAGAGVAGAAITVPNGAGITINSTSATVGAFLSIGSGGQIFNGSDAVDLITLLAAGGDTVDTLGGADTVTGGAGIDRVTLGDGNDSMVSGGGADTVSMGLGDDIISGVVTGATINGDAGTDTVQVAAAFAPATDGALTNVEIVAQTGAGNFINLGSQTEGFSVVGNAGVDTIAGSAGADTINGSGDADSILANAGDDTIVGVTTGATVDGGAGTDTISLPGGVFAPAADTAVANVEAIILTGAATLNLGSQLEAFTVTGSAGADTINGGSGADVITSGGGGDSITGGTGADSITLGAGAETVGIATGSESNTTGWDVLTNFAAGGGADVLDTGSTIDTLNGVTIASSTTGTIAADIQTQITGLIGSGGSDAWGTATDAVLVTVTSYDGGAGTSFYVQNTTADANFNTLDTMLQLNGMTGTLSTTDIA